MKKFLSLFLVITMILPLWGCDFFDYKKAQQSFDDGYYREAKTMFQALGDYEDSAEMVTLCDYLIADDHMNNGEYDEAIEIYKALGDYKDSAALVDKCIEKKADALMDKGEYREARELYLSMTGSERIENAQKAARYLLIQYLKSKGTVSKKEDSLLYLIEESKGKILLGIQWDFNYDNLKIQVTVGAEISPDTGEAIAIGIEDTSSSAAYCEAEATTDFDISKYKSGDEITWDEFDVTGRTAQGERYTQDSTFLNLLDDGYMEKLIDFLADTLSDSGINLTMEDIGFISY